jgi:hypothetical protein
MTLLTGCGTGASDASVCPRVVEYSRADQKRAAGELKTLPAGSALHRMMTDYGIERARLRECR